MTKLIFLALFAYFLWFGIDQTFKHDDPLWFLGCLAVANTFAVILFQSYLNDEVQRIKSLLGDTTEPLTPLSPPRQRP